MTITQEMVKDLRGSTVYDAHDHKLGKVDEVYVDNSSGEPKWVTVGTGTLGTKQRFVPLDGARNGKDGLRVATDMKTVSASPHGGDAEGQLSESEEHQLYRHYGLTRDQGGQVGQGGQDGRGDKGDEGGRGDAGRRGADRGAEQGTEGHRQGDEHAMTRSEERLAVGTESTEAGEVRLRKYVVTETERVDVPVSHEEVRVEREPLTEDRPARGTIGEDERSMTLHAERPVVSKQAHEVERVRLDKNTVTENATVSEELRKERVDVHDPAGLTGEKSASDDHRGTSKKH